jgi:hypothetical protein
MLDLPVGDIAFEGFIHGHLIGREEERDRTRQFFHDILSSKLLVATFVAHEIYQSLAAKRAEEAEEQARVTKLLRELIEDISRSFEEPAMQAEPIPEREASFTWVLIIPFRIRHLAASVLRINSCHWLPNQGAPQPPTTECLQFISVDIPKKVSLKHVRPLSSNNPGRRARAALSHPDPKAD